MIAGEYAPLKCRSAAKLSQGHPLLAKYKDFCSVFGLDQLIREPTRQEAILDHILTNCSEKITQSGVITVGLSDHDLIYCTRKVKKDKFFSHKQIFSRSLKSYSKEKFLEVLNSEIFPNYEDYTDINDAYQDFVDKISSAINKTAPMKGVRIKQGSPDWFDGEILEKIKARDKLRRNYKKSKLQIDKDLFTNARSSVQKLIRDKKRSYYEEKLKEHVGKPKELWKTLKSLGLQSKGKSSADNNISLKQEDDNLTASPTDTANLFKSFYANLADGLLKLLPKPKNRFGITSVINFYQGRLRGNVFSLKEVEEEVVHKLLLNLQVSKAPGIDNIASIFLKDGAEVLCKPLTQIINISLKLSSFPNNAKIAKIKPLFKKGSRLDPKNYRPVSLLPILSKLFERVVHDQTQCYLDENELFYKFQSGFRKNHSTNFCLSYLNDKITSGFDSGNFTGMILIDLQKAFDTIDHNILLEKLRSLNFCEQTVNWFQSYLSNRKFCVALGQTLSDQAEIKCGVPQGSILGPLLFLIYVNDMEQAVTCELLLYADDSCLLCQDKDVAVIEQVLTKNFSSLYDWFVDNKLSIHFGDDKTKAIVFSPKSKTKNADSLNISYGDNSIKQHTEVKYLGCILDQCLSGEPMANQVIGKINSRLKFLYRKNRFLTPELRRLLCNALIQPHFDYASPAWYSNLNKGVKQKLQVLQNKCIRFCLKKDSRTHIGHDEFVSINWLPVGYRANQNISSLVYKFFSARSPIYMDSVFSRTSPLGVATRRSFQRLTQPSRKTVPGQRALSYLGPKLWNQLPETLKSCSSVNCFKHALKRHYFDLLKVSENGIYIY